MKNQNNKNDKKIFMTVAIAYILILIGFIGARYINETFKDSRDVIKREYYSGTITELKRDEHILKNGPNEIYYNISIKVNNKVITLYGYPEKYSQYFKKGDKIYFYELTEQSYKYNALVISMYVKEPDSKYHHYTNNGEHFIFMDGNQGSVDLDFGSCKTVMSNVELSDAELN